MLLRLLLLSGLVCGLAAAAETGPWDRFFSKPSASAQLSAQQGIQQAMSKAVSSAFDPLALNSKVGKSAPGLPPMPTNPVVASVSQRSCSIPLAEYKIPKDKQFFIRSAPVPNPGIDSAAIHPQPAPACK